MKKYCFFLLLFSVFCFGQNMDAVEQPKMIYTENAKFPGGDDAFRAEFHKMVNGYIDLRQYAVNGAFIFTFNIGVDGKIKNLDINPKVKDSDMFIEDMLFAVRKIKTRWKPALQNNKPIESRYIFKVNFTSDHFDHD